MRGIDQITVARPARQTLPEPRDIFPSEIAQTRPRRDILANLTARARESQDILTANKTQIGATCHRSFVPARANRRTSNAHFLPVGKFIKKSLFSFLPVGH
jgi:hypothetical protein